ncbi:MAG: hypothetical protein IPH37_04820 [Burkholderiales bacterium]|nr:hypothetical protein [Burkholderiales bacterium]
MNRLSRLLRHIQPTAAAPCHLAAALAVTLLASACGPGTGGSGGGPIAGTYTTSETYASTASTTASLDGAGDVVVSFGATAIQVEGTCWAFNYQGRWEEIGGEVRVDGFYRRAPTGTDLATAPAIPATLVARTAHNGLYITLREADGTAIATFEPATPVSSSATPGASQPCIAIAPM